MLFKLYVTGAPADALLLDAVVERSPLVVEGLGQQLPVPMRTALHELRAMLLGYVAFLVETKRANLGSGSLFQFVACLCGKTLYPICVHGYFNL